MDNFLEYYCPTKERNSKLVSSPKNTITQQSDNSYSLIRTLLEKALPTNTNLNKTTTEAPKPPLFKPKKYNPISQLVIFPKGVGGNHKPTCRQSVSPTMSKLNNKQIVPKTSPNKLITGAYERTDGMFKRHKYKGGLGDLPNKKLMDLGKQTSAQYNTQYELVTQGRNGDPKQLVRKYHNGAKTSVEMSIYHTQQPSAVPVDQKYDTINNITTNYEVIPMERELIAEDGAPAKSNRENREFIENTKKTQKSMERPSSTPHFIGRMHVKKSTKNPQNKSKYSDKLERLNKLTTGQIYANNLLPADQSIGEEENEEGTPLPQKRINPKTLRVGNRVRTSVPQSRFRANTANTRSIRPTFKFAVSNRGKAGNQTVYANTASTSISTTATSNHTQHNPTHVDKKSDAIFREIVNNPGLIPNSQIDSKLEVALFELSDLKNQYITLEKGAGTQREGEWNSNSPEIGTRTPNRFRKTFQMGQITRNPLGRSTGLATSTLMAGGKLGGFLGTSLDAIDPHFIPRNLPRGEKELTERLVVVERIIKMLYRKNQNLEKELGKYKDSNIINNNTTIDLTRSPTGEANTERILTSITPFQNVQTEDAIIISTEKYNKEVEIESPVKSCRKPIQTSPEFSEELTTIVCNNSAFEEKEKYLLLEVELLSKRIIDLEEKLNKEGGDTSEESLYKEDQRQIYLKERIQQLMDDSKRYLHNYVWIRYWNYIYIYIYRNQYSELLEAKHKQLTKYPVYAIKAASKNQTLLEKISCFKKMLESSSHSQELAEEKRKDNVNLYIYIYI